MWVGVGHVGKITGKKKNWEDGGRSVTLPAKCNFL